MGSGALLDECLRAEAASVAFSLRSVMVISSPCSGDIRGRLTVDILVAVVFLLVSSSAWSLSPQDILKRAEAEVFGVEGLDNKSQLIAAHSAISLGRDTVVTMCESLDEAATIVVLQNEKRFAARIERRDNERNLCILNVPGLGMPTASFSSTDK